MPLALLLTVNAVAIGGILAARDGAREEARAELALETEAHARELEAALDGLRGDLEFLGQAPPLARSLPSPDGDDPMARRWRRLDAEGTLLLFLDAHPAVERLTLERPGEPPIVAGRDASAAGGTSATRDSAVPVILPPESLPASVLESATASGDGEPRVRGRWPVGEGGALNATVRLDELLRATAPGLSGRLTLDPESASGPVPETSADGLTARVPVSDPAWETPLEATLIRRESASRLVQSVEQLAGRYRTTVLLNLAVIALTVALGWLALRQVRRAERLAAESAQERRQRELERRLLHTERLASVGRLAAGMAHEINNPLEGMGNYLALLDDEVEGAEARELVARTREGLERTAAIVHRVLAMSAGGEEAREALDLREVVTETIDFVRSSRSFPGVEIRLAEPSARPEPVAVQGNRVTLGQLVLNLLLNACQAQPGGGEVEVTVDDDDGWARIRIADRGPGLSAEARDRLFEPFFSTRGSTGLGLALCHGIATDHHGRIEAEDRPGGGTVLEVRLPLSDRSAVPQRPRRLAG